MLIYILCVCVCVVQRTGNPEAQLTQEEIQSAIDKGNAQTVEAIECKSVCVI